MSDWLTLAWVMGLFIAAVCVERYWFGDDDE